MSTSTHTDEPAFEHEYDWLVREDAAAWGPGPDARSLVALGAPRLRRRRTALAGGAAGLVAVAVAVPALLLGGPTDPGRPVERPREAPVAGTSSGPDDAPAPEPEQLRGCGWFACADPGLPADPEPPLGEVITIGTTPSGLEEVVWASERTLVDPATQQDTPGVALMTGFVRGDVRYDALLALLPGSELAPGCRMSFAAASSADGGWALLGYVEGEFDRVTSTGGTGDGSVQSSTDVLPGWTVFVARGTGSDHPSSFTAGDVTTPVPGCASVG